MRSDYYDAFRDLHDLYRLSQFDLRYLRYPGLRSNVRDIRAIDDAISRAAAELGPDRTLRPDARHFLLVNAHQMVVLPLTYAESFGREPAAEPFPIVADDIRTILSFAREEAHDNEISGHAVLTGISRAWEKLRSLQLDIWG